MLATIPQGFKNGIILVLVVAFIVFFRHNFKGLAQNPPERRLQ